MTKKTKYFAVVRGNPAGIFNSWGGGASQATQGVAGAHYKSYTTLELAVEWYRQNVPADSRYPSPVYHFETLELAPAPVSAPRQEALEGVGSTQHVVFTICDPQTNEPFYVGETKDLERSEIRHLGSAGRRRKGVSAKIAELLAQGITPVFQVAERHDSKEAALAGKSRLVKLYVQRGLTLYNRTLEHREIQELYRKPAVRLDSVIGDTPFLLGTHQYASREALKCRLEEYLGRLTPGDISNRVAIEKLTLLWNTTRPPIPAIGFSMVSCNGDLRLHAHLADHSVVDFDYGRAIHLIP